MNALRGSDVYRTDDLVKTAPSSNPAVPARGAADGRMRYRGDAMHCETVTLVGWSVAPFGDHSAGGNCRLGYAMGIMSSTLRGSRRILQ